MHNIRAIGGLAILVLGIFSMIGISSAYDTPSAPLADCGGTFVGTHDFVALDGYPESLAYAKNIRLDTSVVLIRSVSERPKMPAWLPPLWTTGNVSISISTMHIRNEMHQQKKLKIEMEFFLVLKFSEPLPICSILSGWEAWMLRQQENPNDTLKEMQLVFMHGDERKILRDYVEVALIPGVHPDALQREIIVPLDKEKITFYSGTPIADLRNGIWKVILRVKDMNFPLRAARILSGQRRFVSSVTPVFVPFISTISTESYMERIASNGKLTRFLDGETIYSEQASFENALQLTVIVDLLRDESGQPYFKLLTTISEFAKSIEDALKPKTEGALRIDSNACFQYDSLSKKTRHSRIHFVCRFVPAIAGRFEVSNIPLRFEVMRGGVPFVVNTERSFVLNTVELRHPEQEGIVSYIGDVRTDAPFSPHASATQQSDTTPPAPAVFGRMRRTIGGTISASIEITQNMVRQFGADPHAFLRRYERSIVATLTIAFILSFVIRTYFWGWGFVPSILSTTSKGLQFALNLCSLISIPILALRDPYRALLKVKAILHTGENIAHLSTELLALRSGIHLDTNRETFYVWSQTLGTSKLVLFFAALWVEEHKVVWILDTNMLETYRVQLMQPFMFRNFLALPQYLQQTKVEYEQRGGYACS